MGCCWKGKLNKLRFSSKLWQIFQIGSLFVLVFQLILRLGFWILYLPIPKMLMCGVHKSMGCLLKKNSRHLKTNINKRKSLEWKKTQLRRSTNGGDFLKRWVGISCKLKIHEKMSKNGETQHLFCRWLNSFDVQCNTNSNCETFYQNVRM